MKRVGAFGRQWRDYLGNGAQELQNIDERFQLHLSLRSANRLPSWEDA